MPDPELTSHPDPQRMNLWEAVKHVLAVRTNVILIVSSACGYYFLAGVQTFGSQFAKQQYDINQAVANLCCSSSASERSAGCWPAAPSATGSCAAAT